MTLRIVILSLFILAFGGCRQYKKIKFEKIIFHSTRCFGSCPAYHSQIDSNKDFLLYSEYVSKTSDVNIDSSTPDSSRMGYFKGRVSDRLHLELVTELENIGLDDLHFDGPNCCDASIKTIIVYYDGKRKFLKSMFPPREADKLISLLRNITESTATQRSDEIFQIEEK